MTGSQKLPVLELAEPCSNSWDSMSGDDRVRHCSDCNLNVYSSIGLREDELFSLVSDREGRLCMRLFKRADGTVVTRDCRDGRVLGFRERFAQLRSEFTALHLLYGLLLFLLMVGLGPLGVGIWLLLAHSHARRAQVTPLGFIGPIGSVYLSLMVVNVVVWIGLAIVAVGVVLPFLLLVYPELFTTYDEELGGVRL